MISRKELQYVELWPSRIPMPGYDYSIEVLKEMQKSYELFNKIYKDKEFSITFSNSEEIDFEIATKNLCHMLGIDYKNIMNDIYRNYRYDVFGYDGNMSSYELLTRIIENMDKIAERDNDPFVRLKVVNYYKSAVKCAILKRLSEFDKFNFAAINYQDEKSLEIGDYFKYLFIPSNEAIAPYFMMGIKYSDDDGKFFVTTLMAPEDPVPFFDNQEVVIPTQILISNSDSLSKIIATPEEKIQLLTMYSSIINEYGLPNRINIYGDYAATLNDMVNTRTLKK